ncbi:MAG: DUF58 domain-containing protein [Microbacteriaceae bacterium]
MPRAVRPPRTSRHRVTLRGVAALVVAAVLIVAGYVAQIEELIIAGCLGVALAVVGYLFVRLRRPRLSVVRGFSPPTVAAGRRTRVSLLVTNRSSATSTPALWNDAVPWRHEEAPQALAPLAPLGANARAGSTAAGRRGTRMLGYDLVPPVRGVFPIGPLALEYADPFETARSIITLGAADELVVVPDLVELPTGSLSVAEGEGSSLLVHRRVTGSDDDLTTREYRSGDAMRRVHWRASARHGELMVRQEEQRSHPEARILVDTRIDGYVDVARDAGQTGAGAYVEQSETFEWIVRMLASLGTHLAEAGFVLSIDESAEAQVAPIGDRSEGVRRDEGFLRSLARIRLVESSGVGPGLVDQRSSGPVFALLAEPDDQTLSWVTRHRRPGDAAVAFLVEPDYGWAGDAAISARSHAIEQTLDDTGWITLRIRADEDPAEAWRAAHAGWGALRGTR